jgi:hypothetical protein
VNKLEEIRVNLPNINNRKIIDGGRSKYNVEKLILRV